MVFLVELIQEFVCMHCSMTPVLYYVKCYCSVEKVERSDEEMVGVRL